MSEIEIAAGDMVESYGKYYVVIYRSNVVVARHLGTTDQIATFYEIKTLTRCPSWRVFNVMLDRFKFTDYKSAAAAYKAEGLRELSEKTYGLSMWNHRHHGSAIPNRRREKKTCQKDHRSGSASYDSVTKLLDVIDSCGGVAAIRSFLN